VNRVIVRENQSYEFALDATVNYQDGVEASFTVDQHEGVPFLNFTYLSYTESDVLYLYLGDYYSVTIADGTAHAHTGVGILNSWEVVT
jgi:hypothetical protein